MNGERMNELALFAGAGGGILGGKLLGWRTVCAVEREPYAASVLVARQNDGLLAPFPVWDDVCTFDGKPWRGIVDVVSGGFPCQDISAAGKGAGIEPASC
jgi:DNA (cytosine-5)-methyltransferase 1